MKTIIFLGLFTLALGGCGGNNDNPPQPPAEDRTPNNFSFDRTDGLEVNTSVESNIVTITGINTAVPISILGGEYSIDGAEYTSNSGTIQNTQNIQLRTTTPPSYSTPKEVQLTIGNTTRIFTVITAWQTLLPVQIEAETGTLMGNGLITGDSKASGMESVGGLNSAGSGVSLVTPQATTKFAIRYSAAIEANLKIAVNGTPVDETIQLPTTGALDTYSTVEALTQLQTGDTVELTLSADSDIRLDLIEFIPSNFQFVETYSTGFAEGDGLAVDTNGNVYLSGGFHGMITRIGTDSSISTFASNLGSANGADFDSNGNLFVASYSSNSVFKIMPDGTRTTFASNLNGPAGLVIDLQDNVYVSLYGANFSGTGSQVLKITPSGTPSVYAQNGGLADVIGLAIDSKNEIYAGNYRSGNIFRISDGNVELFSRTNSPINMIDYAEGYLYIPHGERNRIVRISTLDASMDIFSGLTESATTQDAHVMEAGFSNPNVIAVSPTGNEMFIYDTGTGNLRRIYNGAHLAN